MSLGPLLMALAAAAPEAAATAPQAAAPAANPQQQGVIVYPPEFFASSNPSTAMDMLDRLPGFEFDGGSGVRGFGGAAGNVLIDGERPTSKSDDLQSIVRRIPASQVARIELIRGGAPGIDMQGKTVIVNIVRKKETSVTGLVGVSGTFAYDGRFSPAFRVEGTRRTGDRSLEGSFVIAGFIDDGDGDGPRVRRDGAGAPMIQSNVNTEGDGTQAVATAAYGRPLGGGKFRINGQLFHQKYEEDIDDRFVTPVGHQVERDSNTKDSFELGLHWNRDLGSKTQLETIFLQTGTQYKLYDRFTDGTTTDLFTNRHTNGETVVRGVLRYRHSDTLSFEGGGEVAYNWLHTKSDFSENGAPIALPAADVTVTETRGEAFVVATWKALPTLNVEGALTFEASKIASSGDVVLEKTLSFPKPRLSVTWSPNAGNQVRFKVEREVGQLDFGDFIASSSLSSGTGIHAGNPDLNPQQDWLTEVAVEHRFWGSGSVTLTARHFQITDLVDRAPIFLPPSACNPVPDPNACIFDAPANIGAGKRDALILAFNVPLDKLWIKGGRIRFEGYKRWTEVTDPTTHTKREVSGVHPVDWEAHFSQDLPQWKAQWGVDAYGAWREPYYRYSEVETYKLKTYVTPFLEWKPQKGLSIRFEVQNVTERGFERIRQSYAGPRNSNPLDYTDVRELKFGRMYYVRVRKQFG
jgi:outer membrane receptor protein involved in Fe transport